MANISSGGIAGIVIGSIIALCIIALISRYIYRKRKTLQESPPNTTSAWDAYEEMSRQEKVEKLRKKYKREKDKELEEELTQFKKDLDRDKAKYAQEHKEQDEELAKLEEQLKEQEKQMKEKKQKEPEALSRNVKHFFNVMTNEKGEFTFNTGTENTPKNNTPPSAPTPDPKNQCQKYHQKSFPARECHPPHEPSALQENVTPLRNNQELVTRKPTNEYFATYKRHFLRNNDTFALTPQEYYNTFNCDPSMVADQSKLNYNVRVVMPTKMETTRNTKPPKETLTHDRPPSTQNTQLNTNNDSTNTTLQPNDPNLLKH